MTTGTTSRLSCPAGDSPVKRSAWEHPGPYTAKGAITFSKKPRATIKDHESQCRLPCLLSYGPSGLGRSRNRSSPGSTPFNFGLRSRLSRRRFPFDLGPSCLLSSSHSGSACCTDLSLRPGCFRLTSMGGYITTQDLTQLFLQRLDLLLEVGCSTKFCWCNINHVLGIWME